MKPTELLGDAPEYFGASRFSGLNLAGIWVEIADLAATGVLLGYDRWMVELACHLMAEVRSEGASRGALPLVKKILRKLCIGRVEIAKLTAPNRTRETDAMGRA